MNRRITIAYYLPKKMPLPVMAEAKIVRVHGGNIYLGFFDEQTFT